jgi:predicted NBD/HSP70 family sugar kinase
METAQSPNIEKRKKHYRNRILEIIRHNEQVSRTDIKKLSRLSMTTTLEAIEGMISDGLLVESGTGESTGGRKPTWLKINPEGGFFLGLEFSSAQILYVIIDFCGAVCFSGEKDIPSPERTVDGVIAIVCDCICEMLHEVPDKNKIQGIGLGVPGFVDVVKGVVSNYPFIKGWENVPIRKMIHKRFKLPVYIENNVNAMVLAYKWMEYNGLCDNFVLLTIRTGLRLGFIVRGKLLRGFNNSAGEIDHIKIPISNRMCSCGQNGCLVTEVSHGALVMKMKEGIQRGRFPAVAALCKDRTPEMKDLVAAANQGDGDSLSLVAETAEYVGQMLSNVVSINNPNRIVVNTILSQCGSLFIENVERVVRNNTSVHQTESLTLSYAKYDVHIGAIGAASIVMQVEIGVNADRLL